jgi:hypothetical protein
LNLFNMPPGASAPIPSIGRTGAPAPPVLPSPTKFQTPQYSELCRAPHTDIRAIVNFDAAQTKAMFAKHIEKIMTLAESGCLPEAMTEQQEGALPDISNNADAVKPFFEQTSPSTPASGLVRSVHFSLDDHGSS